MIIPEKNRQDISKYLFQEGVCFAKKDFNLGKPPDIDVPNLQVIKLMQSFKSKEYVRETFAWMHYYWFLTFNLGKRPDIDVPNLQVIKLMQSFKSKEYVRETFAWMHYYWFLTNEGIEFLRTYLNLPSEIVPATLKKQMKPGGRPMGPSGDRPRGPSRFEGDRPRFGDRDGYRGGPRGPPGDFAGEKGGAPAEYQPSFSRGRGGFGRGAGGYGGGAGAPGAPAASGSFA